MVMMIDDKLRRYWHGGVEHFEGTGPPFGWGKCGYNNKPPPLAMPGHKRWDPFDPAQQEEGPDGLILRVSKDSASGYVNIVNVRGMWHAKVAASNVAGDQRTLPGPGCADPRDAAIRLARFLASGAVLSELPPKQERAARGKGKVMSLSHLTFFHGG